MKKVLIALIAFFTMTVAANAENDENVSYTGTVSNIVMGSKTPSDISGVTFQVADEVLTGDFDIPATPSHHLDITAPMSITGTAFTAYGEGSVTVYGVEMPFTANITSGTITDSTITFHCEAVTTAGVVAKFDFVGTKN